MPDPISSSSVLPPASGDFCSVDSDPSLTCHGPESPAPTASPSGPNVCESPATPAAPTASSGTAALVSKFPSSGSATYHVPAPINGTLTVRPGQVDYQQGPATHERHRSIGGLHISERIDLGNIGGHLGELNEDGSRGFNVGGSANVANGEVTLDYKGYSLSFGAGLSEGGSFSIGHGRDLDGDGIPERCFKMTVGPFTLGECDEL